MEENSVTKFQIAYRRVRPYLLTILVILFMSYSIFPDLFPFIKEDFKQKVLFVIGSAAIFLIFDLNNWIGKKIKEVQENLVSIGNQAHSLKNSDPLYNAAHGNEILTPLKKQVAKKLFEASKLAVDGLKKAREFNTTFKYNDALIQNLESMLVSGNKGTIMAACGEKDWKSLEVRKWFELNFHAVKQGIVIKRIFIEEKDMDKVEAEREMQLHADKGIQVRTAPLSKIEKFAVLKGVPKGFGFVIFDDGNFRPKVIAHNDPAKDDSVLFEDEPMIVGQFISTFNELSREAHSDAIIPSTTTNRKDVLKTQILSKTSELNKEVNNLIHNCASLLQLSLLKWRLESETEKLKGIIEQKAEIKAKDSYSYLCDVFGNILHQLGSGDKYQTLSTVGFWNHKNFGATDFMTHNATALVSGCKIERVVFIDTDLLMQNPEYDNNVRSMMNLFKSFELPGDYNLKFFCDSKQKSKFKEQLKTAPRVLITEGSENSVLDIITIHADDAGNNKHDPELRMHFFSQERLKENPTNISGPKTGAFKSVFNEIFQNAQYSLEDFRAHLENIGFKLTDEN